MAEKMRALRTFDGNEGFIRRGDIFEVESKERGDMLARLELAEYTENQEVTNLTQKNADLDDLKKEDLVKIAEKEGVTYRDGALKDEIRTAIINHRERQYYTEAMGETAGTQQTAADAAETDDKAAE